MFSSCSACQARCPEYESLDVARCPVTRQRCPYCAGKEPREQAGTGTNGTQSRGGWWVAVGWTIQEAAVNQETFQNLPPLSPSRVWPSANANVLPRPKDPSLYVAPSASGTRWPLIPRLSNHPFLKKEYSRNIQAKAYLSSWEDFNL